MLDKFGTNLESHMRTTTRDLVERAAKQFDPADPTSPMAKHAAELNAQQEKNLQQVAKNHSELVAKVDELMTTLKVQDARAKLAKVTPIKGGSFEDQVHELMRGIATGLGDEYTDTTAKVGLVPRSKKGDGVLSISGSARVVLEMTDSPPAAGTTTSTWPNGTGMPSRRSASSDTGAERRPGHPGDRAAPDRHGP